MLQVIRTEINRLLSNASNQMDATDNSPTILRETSTKRNTLYQTSNAYVQF